VASIERRGQRVWSRDRSAAQIRTLNAAMKLFADCGASATSYQMIADEVGVTKAAIYHQFKTKDELIIAAAAMELAKLEDALEVAEAEDNRSRGREFLLTQIVDHAVQHRRAATTMLFDPAIVRALSAHEQFRWWFERLYGMLVDDEHAPNAQVQLAALTSVVGGVVAHPLVADLDDDTLRRQLLDVVRRLTDLPTTGSAGARKRATA
jgi:AcrR family transcriptional regulator